MFTIEHLRTGAVAPIKTFGPFSSLDQARAAARTIAAAPPGLITGMDTLRIRQADVELENYKAGDL